jgi:hypothetical protein
MQFPKVTLAICALALGAAGSLGAADNSAQSAARVAMAQKLFELSAQQSPVTNAVPVQPVAVAQPAPVAPPVTACPAVLAKADSQPAKQVQAGLVADNPAQAAARTALTAKLFELGAQQPPVNNAAATPKVAASQPAPVAQPVKTCSMDKTKTSAPTKVKAKVCLAKQAKVCTHTKAESKAQSAAAKKAEKAAADEWYPGKDTGLPPLAAPASPLTPAQESKLKALLENYQADQLTSEQYQQQRAAILAAQ